jgi:hypothetical protein
MIKFYTLPAPTEMQVYAGETGGRAWNDDSYKIGLPSDWAANNTEERIKAILQAKASQFAFSTAEKALKAYYIDAVKDDSKEIIVVLKGIHQYLKPKVGIETAHITVAWYTNLCHFNVKQITGSVAIGVAALGINGVTIGSTSVSSEATGWTVVK